MWLCRSLIVRVPAAWGLSPSGIHLDAMQRGNARAFALRWGRMRTVCMTLGGTNDVPGPIGREILGSGAVMKYLGLGSVLLAACVFTACEKPKEDEAVEQPAAEAPAKDAEAGKEMPAPDEKPLGEEPTDEAAAEKPKEDEACRAAGR